MLKSNLKLKINKQKDLKRIRNKFKHEIKLTITECSLLIALPLFRIIESEAEIVEEICNYLKNNGNCIPEEKFDEITIAMYLNIIEYIDEDKQEELLEMINMAEKIEGLEERIKNRGRRDIINRLLEKYSLEDVSKILEIDAKEILHIIKK